VAAVGYGLSRMKLASAERALLLADAATVDHHPYSAETVMIGEGDTFGTVMAKAGVSPSDTSAILAASEPVYDLTSVRLGRGITVVRSRASNELLAIEYRIDSEEMLRVSHGNDGWTAERSDIPYETTEKFGSGVIESSMYQAGLDAGIDERAIVAASEVFQWSVDFALDVRKGDMFAFLYEERHLNGNYEGPGSVLAAKFVNAGTEFYGFRFEMPDGEVGYYDEEGNSLQKLFLKAPVHFKYITSGFTTGLRYVSQFNTSTGHRAIDYAAPSGTPIRAVGDGTVVGAGWNGPYGNWTSIRHNATYTTNYAHQSRIIVKRGQQVSQGEIIGYVGSTGFSTGPHLHYEMVKNGTKINPLAETFPSGDPLPEQYKEEYLRIVEALKPRLNQ
jgi:murein DD-endopeptidase MepM/ murein hydrolase activator NlpD